MKNSKKTSYNVQITRSDPANSGKMVDKQASSRREFFKKGLAGAAGATMMGASMYPGHAETTGLSNADHKLPREVVIASLSQHNMEADTHMDMVRQVMQQMRNIANHRPDVICLPETFPVVGNRTKTPPIEQIAENARTGGPILNEISAFAKDNSCYVVCPIYTVDSGKYYNAAVLIDRQGEVAGEYRKVHPAVGEDDYGVVPGPLDPPVFQTDFGIIGIQICFDIKWQDAWKRLADKGAEIVFWPSAFSGGQMICANAWMYQYYTVSSSWKDTTRICDITGEPIAWTGRWDPRWAIATINLEKVFIHAYPLYREFNDIRKKYGTRVRIKTFHEEEWAVIESRSADVRISDIMDEFGLISQRDYLKKAEADQIKDRKA